MDDLSVSTDYTRYHDKCKSCLHVVERAINWSVNQSLWIPLPLTADAVPVLPSYTRCCSAFHNTQFYRGLCLYQLPSQAGKSQESHNILRYRSQYHPWGVPERIPELSSGRDADAPLLAKLGCKYPQKSQIHS